MVAEIGSRMQTPTDHLVARCRAGDIEAFRLVFVEYEQPVFRHAYRLLGNQEDALDVCQETFVRAFPAIRSFRGDCTLRAWLLRICTNLCRNHLRTRRRRREVPIEQVSEGSLLGDAAADPAARVERQELAAVLHAALQRLSPGQREVIVLRDLESLPFAEIAVIIGGAVASVPVKLFRARKRLKEEIKRLMLEKE